MNGRLALISTLAACVLATPAALAAPPGVQHPPAAEEKASCAGLYASFNAPLGAEMSDAAGPGFGSDVVAPFAHERLPCP